jgi:hypothetical protein
LFEVAAATKDSTNGRSAGWERFDFDKDAPLDDDDQLDEIGGLLSDTSYGFVMSAIGSE